MEWLGISLLIIVALVVVIKKLRLGRSGSPSRQQREEHSQGGDVSYSRNSFLMSDTELNFYKRLRNAVAGKYLVCIKVRIADVVSVRSADRSRQRSSFNRLAMKHFDFVLLDARTMSISHAIELDDSSHSSKKMRERDSFVDDVCSAAGLELVRFKAQGRYPMELFEEKIKGVGYEDDKSVSR